MEEIAIVYARSLFEVARDHGDLDSVREQLGQFADALEENRDLQVFFFSPYFSTEEKKDGLKATLEDAEPTLMNFLELLLEQHRMPAIFRIKRQLDRLWEDENRLLPVQITSATGRGDDRRDRRPHRRADRTPGGPHLARPARHPRRPRRPGRQLHSRRVDRQSTRTTTQASRQGLVHPLVDHSAGRPATQGA
jgi:F-type H+-transporting ATPase subunit delta